MMPPVKISTLRVSRGWIVDWLAARAMAPAKTSLAGLRSTCAHHAATSSVLIQQWLHSVMKPVTQSEMDTRNQASRQAEHIPNSWISGCTERVALHLELLRRGRWRRRHDAL